jgi:xanthine dehydrogenase accessory factor
MTRGRTVILALALLVPLALAAGYVARRPGQPAGTPTPAAVPAEATDPVCGMSVDSNEAKFAGRTSRHDGRDYYFCNPECRKAFDADPARYAKNGS